MPKPRKAEAARPVVAAIVGRVEDLQQTIQRVKSILGTFEGKVSNLEEEITKEVMEKEDAIRGHLNSTRENDSPYQQMEKEKQAHLNTYNALKEDHAEIVADERRIVLEMEALKRQVAGLKGDTTLRDQALKQIDENNGKILRLGEHAKNHAAEVEHLQGAERKFVLELEKNADKDKAIQKMKEEIENLQRYQVKYDDTKKEIAGLLKDEEAHLLRAAKMQEGNDHLEDIDNDLMVKAGGLVGAKEEMQQLHKSVDDLKQQASENEANSEAIIEENAALKVQIQALEVDRSASIADIQAVRTRHLAAVKEIEVLEAKILAFTATHDGSFRECQMARVQELDLMESRLVSGEEVERLRAKIYELEDERTLIEPLTMLGVTIRSAFLRYGRGHEMLNKIVGPVMYAKDILADAALYHTSFLSEEGDGQLFLNCYGCSILVSLDYGAMTKFCKMMPLVTQFEDYKGNEVFPRLAALPEWAEREQVIAGLQTVWNEVVLRAPLEFEGRADVDLMLVKLERLTESLYRTLHYLIGEDEAELEVFRDSHELRFV